MALIKACSSGNVLNTGFECSELLDVPAGVIMVPGTAKWTQANMQDFPAFVKQKLHTTKSDRWYPVFSDLVNFEVNKESDQVENFANGTSKLTRLGAYGFTLSFAEGGECLAKALLSFNKMGYRPILIDVASRFKVRKNIDGTFSGLKVSDLYGGSPDLTTFDASFKNKLIMSITVKEYIQNAAIFQDASDLTDFIGLLDVDLVSAAAATTTKLTVKASTDCGGTDLYDMFKTQLAVPTAWKVSKAGAAIVPTAVATNDMLKAWEITVAAQTSGDILSVSGADASVWLGLNVEGYEAAQAISITIP